MTGGLFATVFAPIPPPTGRENLLDFPGYEEKLAEALTAHLREAVPDQESYDTMFTHEIKPNGNFTVSEQGVTYIYNQYEIAPYSMGAIHVSVPWDEIRDLIRE